MRFPRTPAFLIGLVELHVARFHLTLWFLYSCGTSPLFYFILIRFLIIVSCHQKYTINTIKEMY